MRFNREKLAGNFSTIKPISFEPTLVAVAVSREPRASAIAETPDRLVPVDGATFGVVNMSENSRHDGEMHH